MTNSYQASIDGFMEHLNLTKDESYNLIKESVELAKIACDRYKKEFPNSSKCFVFFFLNNKTDSFKYCIHFLAKPRIVGSVGPYGASLHDGSEYTGSYAQTTSVNTMREWHIPRIKALVEGGVDLLAFETIPCRSEAEMLVELLKTDFADTKAWLAFSVSVRNLLFIYYFKKENLALSVGGKSNVDQNNDINRTSKAVSLCTIIYSTKTHP